MRPKLADVGKTDCQTNRHDLVEVEYGIATLALGGDWHAIDDR